ncbi:serine-rich adhesin for platelets [Rhagoletis pomonella]|uniref:serine-rich adhesin for platelets n=1 Tax=Rhagoletis pomonella TaxID=28610 RepID=UPI001784F6E9|nr:serine-rich adhesin for platelets [Rhagoletis pomonella]XP_036321127.1 serine-rich adhesin for platelets [Rhagoletis pomonella]XP_036321128.1 serine-rich adhesin for platelets [Rhagoletis pomonella]XP_036321129.1 serine-rich adhesin for platelets [Rhagoletis pomonella]XP_036321130.1 serine-rich adhesin for platelets [Rhagoletis pomonella]XP_036321131.1 serine-rich adhesin for platelets [Rhagoletis pomonella]XP_036321132.1 serine-rich adhesin for platelets [Rhagoletis pomonella]XP_03632113
MANTLSVMTNVLRNVVSKQRIRYKENGYNLDLAYICDNIIAMGYPADNIESIFRNRLEDVYKFLQEIHQNHYKIYNLCLERSYDSNKFHGRVAVYPFEDHNPPTIELIQRFCADVDTWLKADSQNVAAVHCKAGKGRTGTMICCYLLYSGQQQTAEDALECYAEKRTKDRKGVTIPSQRRYVQYFAKLIRSGVTYEKRILQFCEIRFTEANLLHSHGTVHCSISVLEDNGCSVKVMPLLGLPIDFRKSYTLDLKNHSLCVAGDIKVELTHKKKLFHFWFNTYFVRDDSVIEEEGEEAKLVYTLNKCEIDDAHKDKEHKSFSEGFKVQLVFYTESSMRPGLQANVSSIASQISNNQRKSQNARLSHQYSGGGGDSSSSSNCQLPQNSSSGSDLNYICDQKSSSSASASVSSFGGPLIGGSGGSGSIGDTSMGDAANAADYSCLEGAYAGTQFMQQLPPYQYALQQQQQKQRISVSYKQQYVGAAKNITGGSSGGGGVGCDSYNCDADVTPFGGRITAATTTVACALPTQQQPPQHTYVNLENIMPAADKQQYLQQMQEHEVMKSLLTTTTTTPNVAKATLATVTAPSTAINSFKLATAIQQQSNAAKFMTPSAAAAFTGGQKNILQHQQASSALQLVGNTTNNNSNSRQVDKGNIAAAAQSNGAVGGCGGGGGGEVMNGRISGNSSKSSINSQSSSSASTTSSASSSVPTSAGDQDCEEEDWESGECHPKMSHTIAYKALQSSTLLAPSKPPTANNTITITTTSTIPFTTATTHSKLISTPISQLPSTFYMNINSNSGSYTCSYCCDDDEINRNLKCECDNVQNTEKLKEIESIITNERRSSCTASKSNGGIEKVLKSIDLKNRSNTEFRSNNTATGNAFDGKLAALIPNPIGATEGLHSVDSQYPKLVPPPSRDKVLVQVSMSSPKKTDGAAVSSNKTSPMSNVSSVVSSWTHKPLLFQHKLGGKKMRDLGVVSSAAIAVAKANPATTDGAVLALSCSPATSGCSGLASTSRRKLKNKLKNNTKKLSHWLQNHFRANPVEFCENVVQHTTSIRRNSNCSVSSRSHKMSMSSTTGTPVSSLPKQRPLLATSEFISENCIIDGGEEAAQMESCDIYGDVEGVLKGGTLAAVAAAVNIDVVGGGEGDGGGSGGGGGRTKISLSESMTASNGSLSTVGGGSGVGAVGHSGGGSGSSDAFEDFYSSNCDNQLSFNNSPCKSPRSLVDIGSSSAYSVSHELHYATSFNERNSNLRALKRGELHMLRIASAHMPEQQQHQHQQQLHQLNVVVVAAKPAKTHAIGFNVTEERTHDTDADDGEAEVEVNEKDAGEANDINASDITVGANVTIVTTDEQLDEKNEKKREEQAMINKCQAPLLNSYMLDTKIDEVDEDCDEDGATTASSIYYTPTLVSAGGAVEIDGGGIKAITSHYPFTFPNMQDDLAHIAYSSDCPKANDVRAAATDSDQNVDAFACMTLEKCRLSTQCGVANVKLETVEAVSATKSAASTAHPASASATVTTNDAADAADAAEHTAEQ